MLLLLVSIISLLGVFAHSGRTDGNGGHWDRSAGEYHYHHGYGEHDHPNGICPYTKEEAPEKPKKKTSSSSSYSSSSSKKALEEEVASLFDSPEEQETEDGKKINTFTYIVLALLALLLLFAYLPFFYLWGLSIKEFCNKHFKKRK